MNLLDSNLLIRFLTNDDPSKAEKVEKLLRTNKTKIYLSDVSVAETVWVLKSVYGVQKDEIVQKLKLLFQFSAIKYNKKIIDLALANYRKFNISWIDSYLSSLNQSGKYKGLYSYDESLDKVAGVVRLEPK